MDTANEIISEIHKMGLFKRERERDNGRNEKKNTLKFMWLSQEFVNGKYKLIL